MRRHIRSIEDRLARLEARSHEQCSNEVQTAGTTQHAPDSISCFCAHSRVASENERPLQTAASGTQASDLISLGASSWSPREGIPNVSLLRSSQLDEGVLTSTELGLAHQQNITRTNGATTLDSSNMGFVRSLNVGWSMPLKGVNTKHRLPTLPKLLWKRLESSTMIPPRPVADDLLQSYFTFAHEFLPVFYRLAFDREYERLWTSSTLSRQRDPREHLEDVIFLSTLNVCIALGSLFSHLVPDEDRESTSNEYYERSRALINFDVCDYSSLSTVRLQLITGLYLQTTSHVSRCWNVVGMAIRLGQDLGLHKDPSETQQSDQLEVEMKRRIWYSCVAMDM